MQLTHHSEYQTVYLHHQRVAQGCQAAVIAWRASEEVLDVAEFGLHWTPATAHTFVAALSQLFQRYNQVLWQDFHYCHQCGGQCCVVDASDVRAFDLIAMTLLDLPPPLLPERIAANPQDCIYLAGSQCTWPSAWRTLKCWSFYCLGSGPWPATAALGALYQEITAQLQSVVSTHLPAELRRYEQVRQMNFADHLADPVDFSNTLHIACQTLLVAPLQARFPTFALEQPSQVRTEHSSPIFLLPEHDLYEFITEATEALYASPPVSPTGVDSSVDQFLVDLETLTWLIEHSPAQYPPEQSQQQLNELYQRYADAPIPAKGETPTLWYRMRNQILELLNPG
jgi:hypothetical protein